MIINDRNSDSTINTLNLGSNVEMNESDEIFFLSQNADSADNINKEYDIYLNEMIVNKKVSYNVIMF